MWFFNMREQSEEEGKSFLNKKKNFRLSPVHCCC